MPLSVVETSLVPTRLSLSRSSMVSSSDQDRGWPALLLEPRIWVEFNRGGNHAPVVVAVRSPILRLLDGAKGLISRRRYVAIH